MGIIGRQKEAFRQNIPLLHAVSPAGITNTVYDIGQEGGISPLLGAASDFLIIKKCINRAVFSCGRPVLFPLLRSKKAHKSPIGTLQIIQPGRADKFTFHSHASSFFPAVKIKIGGQDLFFLNPQRIGTQFFQAVLLFFFLSSPASISGSRST